MRFWYYRSIALRSALKVDRIITVSENAKLEIMESFGIEDSKISVVYHGLDSKFKEGFIDQERIKSTLMNYNLQPGYLFYVGTTAPHKNIGNLIKSLSILKNQHSISCQLVIAGPDHSGSIPYLRSIAETLGVSEQIVLLGYIPHEELPFLYRGAKIFALLSLCESFGLPVLEAMACGCPVVCSNVSSLPEIAGNAAVLVDPKDPANVADMIRVLFEDEEYREHMIALGKRRAQEFSWTRTADQIVSIIEQAARN
jgi:glycosyltransferase involved in cell wall biosynthesis